MNTLDDRMHEAAAEIQRAAMTIPTRPTVAHRSPFLVRAAGWAAAGIAVAALIAVPLWLGPLEDDAGRKPFGGEAPSSTTVPSDGPRRVTDEEFAAAAGGQVPGLIPGSATLVATVEQEGFGWLSLYTYEEDLSLSGAPDELAGRRDPYCVTAFGDVAYAQEFDGKPLQLGAGASCGPTAEHFEFGLEAGSVCVPRVESMFALYGLDATVTTVTFTMTDGTAVEVEPVNGTVLFAWHGSRGLAAVGLDEDADRGLQERVAELIASYGTPFMSHPCSDA
jgi:hypothetical protein